MPGVKAVKSHIVWIEPMSAMTFAIRTTAMAGTSPAHQLRRISRVTKN